MAILTAAIALCGLTVFIALSPWRFTVVADDSLRNANFGQGGNHWHAYGDSIQVLRGPPVTVAMAAVNGNAHWLGQRLPVPETGNEPAFDHYRVHAEAASDRLQGAHQAWQGGRLSVVSLDRRGQRLWYLPDRILRESGQLSIWL